MVFSALKYHTQSHHSQLEETVDILNRMKTVPEYQRVLETFYGFYKPVEARLSELSGIEAVDFQARRKIDLLRSDLGQLGLSGDEIDQLPLCHNLPEINTLEQAYGCLYVLEGATLGGQMIARQIEKQSAQPLPHRFFTAYGAETGRQWKALQDVVEHVVDHQANSTLITSAQDTFKKLEHWFLRRNP